MSTVTKGTVQQSYGKFLSIPIDRSRYIALKVIFIVSIVISWIYLSINVIDLLGEVIIAATLGGGTIDVISAVHFPVVIWGIVVIVIVSVLHLLLRRTK
jgi:hypothetical protein